VAFISGMRSYCVIALGLLLLGFHTNAEEVEAKSFHDGPKIGVVLGGGGARGAAHVGVLRKLEELNIPIDYIAGTSMGSIVAGLYAAGLTPDEIEEAIKTIDWESLFDDAPPREELSFRRKRDDELNLVGAKLGVSSDGVKISKAVVQGQKFDLELNKLTHDVAHVEDFNEMAIPFRAVATDIATGEAVVLDHGNLALALRASMSVPAAFAGVDIEGKYLVDGGVANNLPINVVRDMGADIVIAVSVASPLKTRDEIQSSLDVISQLVDLLTYRNVQQQIASLEDSDILIHPELGDITSADFSRAYQAIEKGEVAATRHEQRLRKLSVSGEEYQNYLAWREEFAKQAATDQDQILAFFEIDNDSPLSDSFILSRVTDQTGQILDVALLESEISELYGLDVFENVRYELKTRGNETGVILHVIQKGWGPNYLQGGLATGGNLKGDSSINVSLAYTRTMINSLNGEWRTYAQLGDSPKLVTELYQPLDFNSKFYFNPKLLLADQYNLKAYDGDYAVGEYRIHRYGASLAVGSELGAWGDLRLTWRRYRGEVEARVGQPPDLDDGFQGGELVPSFYVDKLDSLDFPNNGHLLLFEWVDSDERYGADDNFEQYRFDSLYAKTWGRQTYWGGLKIYTSVDDKAPYQNQFQAGGFQNLSGYQFNELNGQHYGLMRLGTMRKVNDFQWMPAYVGVTFELGEVSSDHEEFLHNSDNLITSGNVFFGLDTGIGPLYFAYGNSEGGNDSFYVFLGRPFTFNR